MVNENNKEALSYFKTQGFQNGEKMIWAQKYQK